MLGYCCAALTFAFTSYYAINACTHSPFIPHLKLPVETSFSTNSQLEVEAVT